MLLVAAVTAAMVGLFTGSDWQAWFAGPALGVLALLAALRLAGVPRWLSPLVAVCAGLGVMFGLYGEGDGLIRLVPTPSNVAHIRDLFAEAATLVVESSTPVTPTPQLMLLTATAAGLLALLLDLFVIEAGLGGAAALAALAALAVPVFVNVSGLHLGRAAVVAAAVLLVLWAATPRWVRPRAPGASLTAGWGPSSSRVVAALGTMTAVAVVAALSPIAVPGYSSAPLVDGLPKLVYFANGPNPLVDLGADLTDRVAKEALRLTTDAEPPPYLRMVTLEDFTGDTWRHRSTEPRVVQDEDSSLLDLRERGDAGGGSRWFEIEVTGMRSQWLPVPYPARTVTDLTGRWLAEEGDSSIRALQGSAYAQSYRVDSPDKRTWRTVDVGTFDTPTQHRIIVLDEDGEVTESYTTVGGFSGEGSVTIGGSSDGGSTFYEITSPDDDGADSSAMYGVAPFQEGATVPGGGLTAPDDGEAAGSDVPASVLADLELPPDLPAIISETADTIAGDLDDPILQATALEQFFASSGLFVYSTSAPSARGYEGDSAATVASFLSQGAGYCVHFASAMTLMARSLGIPARIALGYVPGAATSELADGREVYAVTTKSLHSWPELYVPSLGGWTSYEPTPGLIPGTAPPRDSTSDWTPPSASPSSRPTPSATPSSRPVPSRSTVPARRSTDDAGPDLTLLMWVAVGLAAVAAAGAIPAMARARRRRRRWRLVEAGGAGAIGAAWTEVRDTARDLGLGAPVTETPRAFAERIATWWDWADAAGERGAGGHGEPHERDAAREALTDLLGAVEAVAFAGHRGGEVSKDAGRAIVQRLRGVVTRRRRVRAAIMPISLVRALWARRAGAWPPPDKGNY
jgi:transglutaminase-like putative cysteine protease